jgi:hypothetical protein
MTELVYRHQDGQNLAELTNFKLVQGQLFKNNGKNHYLGAAPYPVAPAKGDLWTEYDASDNFLEDWVYNGTIWLSKEILPIPFQPPSSALTAVVNSPTFPIYTVRNILLLNMLITGVQSILASGTNNWSLTLARLAQPGTTATTITTFNTSAPTAFAANQITTVVHPINTLIDTAATGIKALRVTELRTAGTSTKNFSYTIQYKKARP